jgi:hypothetical protein
MAVFDNHANSDPEALLADPEEDTCVWCVLRKADAGARQLSAVEGKRSPAPWMVPPGLLPRPAEVDR